LRRSRARTDRQHDAGDLLSELAELPRHGDLSQLIPTLRAQATADKRVFADPVRASLALRPSCRAARIVALETPALSPTSQLTRNASAALLACHQLSAKTTTASLSLMTRRMPRMPASPVSSIESSVPANAGHWRMAA